MLRALDDVEAATHALRGAAQTEWCSDAADRFRIAVEEATVCVARVRTVIERTVQPVAASDLEATSLAPAWYQ